MSLIHKFRGQKKLNNNDFNKMYQLHKQQFHILRTTLNTFLGTAFCHFINSSKSNIVIITVFAIFEMHFSGRDIFIFVAYFCNVTVTPAVLLLYIAALDILKSLCYYMTI